jgi:Bifunctional DNA primase/polymerase, N-terminal
MNTRDAAVAATRRGWAVFPCRYRAKLPAVDDWENRAICDPERVARYWPSDTHNVGIACGPSRLVVIDLDTHGTLPDDWRMPGIADGRDVLAQLCEWAGQPWPCTYTVRTPLDGWHLVFATPDGQEIRNSRGKLGPLVDVRGNGGYVLAAGSVVDERAYPKDPAAAAIVEGGKPYEVIDDSPPEPLPGWLATLAAPPPPEPARAPALRASGAPNARLRGLIATVAGGQPGDRNDPLYWASCRAAEMIAAGEVDQQTAENALVAAALEAGLRGGEREARRTFASAMHGGSR